MLSLACIKLSDLTHSWFAISTMSATTTTHSTVKRTVTNYLALKPITKNQTGKFADSKVAPKILIPLKIKTERNDDEMKKCQKM